MGGRLPRIFLADLDDVKAVPLAVVRKGLADRTRRASALAVVAVGAYQVGSMTSTTGQWLL